jgi:single-stranded-DNA-specific exonuclease
MVHGKKWKILNENINRSIIDVTLENRNLPESHLDSFKLSERMHSPYLLPDMDKAVNRILSALEKKEKIIIFGDYDVDGVTSTALLVLFFRKLGKNIDYILPHRELDGYGLRESGIDKVEAMGGSLIITVDNGITSNSAIAYAKTKNIDVVITDHHLQEGQLPEACAVVNPNRTDSEYPFKTICGAFVAFKLIQALSEKLLPEMEYKHFLVNHTDLTAIGTISDVMPLKDENYAIVKYGLKVLSTTKRPGLIALKKVSGVHMSRDVTTVSVGFFMAPRLNAAGRLDSAENAVRLLISEDFEEAEKIAEALHNLNKTRQELQTAYIKEAIDQLPPDKKDLDRVIIVENRQWQPGLIGLISGQLKERFYRPALAFTQDENQNYVGSARSIDSFHITNALAEFNACFLNYGGHKKAAGLTVKKDQYAYFKNTFIQFANEQINDDDLLPELVIDSVVNIDQINLSVSKNLQSVGPFGEGNPEPVFLLKGVQIKDIYPMKNGKHLKITVQKDEQVFECVWWNSGAMKDEIAFSQTIDIVFKMGINYWQGSERLQLILEDIR